VCFVVFIGVDRSNNGRFVIYNLTMLHTQKMDERKHGGMCGGVRICVTSGR
jgi:hypothetical protein